MTSRSPPTTNKSADKDKSTPSADANADVDTSTAEGNWLLGIQTAGGADAETSTTTYVTYNPATGQATARKLPGGPGRQRLARRGRPAGQRRPAVGDPRHRDHRGGGAAPASSRSTRWPRATRRSSTSGGRTGDDGVKAIGWAFDPERADTLRVVDTANRVWAVNVAGGKATQEGTLAKGPWVFTNGFNHNTGEPYMESIESDETNPAGNGPADTSPVTRDGGTILPAESEAMTKLPASPCRLGAGFTDANGVTWVFCADESALTTYYLPKDGEKWTAYGKPSTAGGPRRRRLSRWCCLPRRKPVAVALDILAR